MTEVTGESALRATEHLIGTLMPTALDMIASVVEDPTSSLDNYDRLLTVAEVNSPVLLLAVLRCAAGLAAIGEVTAADIRALMDADRLAAAARE